MDPNQIILKSYDYRLVVRAGFISILTASARAVFYY